MISPSRKATKLDKGAANEIEIDIHNYETKENRRRLKHWPVVSGGGRAEPLS
jgi:hypothetical protein